MLLHKYVGPAGIDLLEKKRLKLSRAKEFNDPFEFKIAFDPVLKAETVLHQILFADVQEWAILLFRDKGLYTGSQDKFVKWFKQDSDWKIKEFQDKYPILTKYRLDRLYEFQNKYYGISSLTANENDILMWGHYTEKHTGFLVSIDFSFLNHKKKKVENMIEPVKYSERRVVFPSSLSLHGDFALDNLIKEVVWSKSVHWSYEKEYRGVTSGHKRSGEAANIDFLNLPASSIKQIVLGCNSSLGFEKSILHLLSDREFQHVNVLKAVIDDSTYSLNYRELPKVQNEKTPAKE